MCTKHVQSVVNKDQNEDQRKRPVIGEFTTKRIQEERIRVDPREMRGVLFCLFSTHGIILSKIARNMSKMQMVRNPWPEWRN